MSVESWSSVNWGVDDDYYIPKRLKMDFHSSTLKMLILEKTNERSFC